MLRIEVNLYSEFPYFSSEDRIQQLNRIVRLHTELSPQVIMTATGCSFQQALQILLVLFELELAEAFILVYLRDDPDVYIAKRHIRDGPPKFPFQYDHGDQVVNDPNEVLYGFEFDISTKRIIHFSNEP